MSSGGAEVKDKEDNTKVTGSNPGDCTMFNSLMFENILLNLKI